MDNSEGVVSAVPKCPVFRISEKVLPDAKIRMKVVKLGFRVVMVSHFRGCGLKGMSWDLRMVLLCMNTT